MGRLFITLLAPLTYLHFGGATLLVVNQPPRATISRSVSTQRLGQPYVNQPFRNTNNVFGINSQTQQWPRSARRRGDVTFKRERPTHAWIPEPSGMLTQWPQGQRTQSEWIPIESIPKSNNPSEWIQRRNVPPPKLFKPEVTSTRKVSNRRRPIESKPSKTKRRRKSSTKKKWKRTLSDEETLNLMEKYVNKKLALEERRIMENEQTKNVHLIGVNEQHTFEELPTTNTTESKPLDLDSVSNTDSLINDILASALPQESFDILGLDSSIGQYITQDNTTKSEVQPVTRPEVQPVTRPEVQPVTQPEEQPISRPEVQPVARAEVQPVTRPEVQPFVQPEVQPVTRPEVQPVTRPEVQPVTQPEEQPISRPEVQPVARAEVQPVTRLEVQPFAQPEVQPVVRPEVQPVTRPEDLTRVDNQSISQIPTYSFEGETTETSNHTVETESVTKAIEVDISARRTRDKPMAHSLDNIKEITKTDKTGQMPSPALAQDLPFESATERLPERERRPLYDIFGGGRQQLDLFSSDPPVDRNHPFSNRFKSNRFQQFEVSDNQINTNNDMFHRESSPHHSSNRPTTKTSEHPQYDQRHIQTFDQPAYRERHTDARDHQPYEIPPQHHDNSLDSFSRRRPKPRHQELHHIEISIPTNNGWETHSSSIYGIDPSETRHAHYDPPPVENQGFERRRKPTGYFRQSSGTKVFLSHPANIDAEFLVRSKWNARSAIC
ncbi:cip1-interacting zinc finger protein-like [Pecten maximus]|uniref:cip1-interacting zinc finger protein-like n=1 Tax=Pecten maximus TaxID=6579 RepID=UPI001458D7A8|nr:cip1-interacting zinc finger protein-like [Pecten maximus]